MVCCDDRRSRINRRMRGVGVVRALISLHAAGRKFGSRRLEGSPIFCGAVVFLVEFERLSSTGTQLMLLLTIFWKIEGSFSSLKGAGEQGTGNRERRARSERKKGRDERGELAGTERVSPCGLKKNVHPNTRVRGCDGGTAAEWCGRGPAPPAPSESMRVPSLSTAPSSPRRQPSSPQ